jgi:AP-3 complex subunit delta
VRYVALLAFNSIILTHPYLVAQQEDVIMDCLDSADISIRLRALDLVSGMVSSENLMTVVGRLMRQLRSAGSASLPVDKQSDMFGIDPRADSDDEAPEINIRTNSKNADTTPPLPDEYRVDVINRILDMCAANNYSNLLDFDWYINVLLQLVRSAPIPNPAFARVDSSNLRESGPTDISEKVGDELRNIAVKVRAVRATASRAAESLILASYNGNLSQTGTGKGALRPAAWVAGEYASCLLSPENVLTALLHMAKSSASPECLVVYLQAIPKIFAYLTGDERLDWTAERKTMTSLLMARVIHTLEPLASHPDLEVQERAVEFAELLRLAAEASAAQEASAGVSHQDTPLLLTQAIPSLFAGLELNSVAPGAQRNVPIPTALDLDQPINSRLNELLQAVDASVFSGADHDEIEAYYHHPPVAAYVEPAINRLIARNDDTVPSYQQGSEENYVDTDIIERRRAERRERNKDDPFYIAGTDHITDVSTPLDSIIQSENDNDLDIDSIPIMQLDLGQTASTLPHTTRPIKAAASKARQLIQVAADETLSTSGTSTPRHDDSELSLESTTKARSSKSKNPLLQVDSSSIGTFSLEGQGNNILGFDHERQQREDAEMAKAMQEVERLRLEMQRASERIQAAQGVPPEGTLVKKKVKKKTKPVLGDDPRKNKKKEIKKPAEMTEEAEEAEVVTTVKRQKKKKAKFDDDMTRTGD